jgi:hypothetical protein
VTAPRQTLDYGLVGALTVIAFTIVLAIFLSIATDWHGDAVP